MKRRRQYREKKEAALQKGSAKVSNRMVQKLKRAGAPLSSNRKRQNEATSSRLPIQKKLKVTMDKERRACNAGMPKEQQRNARSSQKKTVENVKRRRRWQDKKADASENDSAQDVAVQESSLSCEKVQNDEQQPEGNAQTQELQKAQSKKSKCEERRPKEGEHEQQLEGIAQTQELQKAQSKKSKCEERRPKEGAHELQLEGSAQTQELQLEGSAQTQELQKAESKNSECEERRPKELEPPTIKLEEKNKTQNECARASYLDKKAALGRQTQNSEEADEPTSSKLEKRPRDMTEEELRAYKARQRKRQRDSRSSQKKTADAGWGCSGAFHVAASVAALGAG
ncbi:hypothetical protein ElyMa_001031600 [Elysia marginata]|uniref:Vicilin-like seed storage protein At2g18540 n=1 Tax=Elysia marginata TaxID=1093978 RepID=A0AAV4HMH2_9GAST|nr:hypothetical protein ElyMa_001031600 [Elysia marginata]